MEAFAHLFGGGLGLLSSRKTIIIGELGDTPESGKMGGEDEDSEGDSEDDANEKENRGHKSESEN